MTLRNTWLKGGRFIYRFLLDNESPQLLEEQKLHDDIIFLNATFRGAARGFGEKMLFWLRYAYQHFPNALLIAKLDDDVFVCEEKMLKKLINVYHPRLYFGIFHNVGDWQLTGVVGEFNRIDEMFVVVGRHIVGDIIKARVQHIFVLQMVLISEPYCIVMPFSCPFVFFNEL